MFIGRHQELNQLKDFKNRKTAGLAVIYGRRRIGKSTLIEQFAKKSRFLEFYGLPPRQCASNEDQLKHFGQLMGKAFDVPAMQFSSWFDAFSTLAGLTSKGKYIILFDEISWLAEYDRNLPGILKGIWDTEFKKNNGLLLILCGSVSAWIENNILKDKGYMGRVSLQMKLKELPLNDANKFWQNDNKISAFEKFKCLCITGGIPRYLEELNTKQTAEENIKRLCYSSEGLLFNEFDTIFHDIFGKKDEKYRAIANALVNGPLDQSELSKKLNIEQSGAFSDLLNTLQSAGFIQRDYIWNPKTGNSTTSRYRLSDNYLRFYLKYIEPKKQLIRDNLYYDVHLESLPEWQAILGLQFENLVLNNLKKIIKHLNIAPETIISASPYSQKDTTRQKGVQIDLLIHTQYTIYVCEIKFRKRINSNCIAEMTEKIIRLKAPAQFSIRPVLIYQGVISETVVKSNYFSHLISFSDLLNDEN